MTKKPCPGCGLVKHNREADKVCGECQRLLKAGKAAEEWVRDPVNGFEQTMRSRAAHDMPRPGVCRASSESMELFRQAWHRLQECATVPFGADGWAPVGSPRMPENDMHSMSGHRAVAAMPAGFSGAAKAVVDLIDVLCVENYNAGLVAGKKALVSMAEGRLRPEELTDFGKQQPRQFGGK